MKYSEFKKAVEGLSRKYKVETGESFLIINYKNNTVLMINLDFPFWLEVETPMYCIHRFNMLPFSHKLYMLSAELAMTPPDERKEVQLYGVRNKDVHDGEYTWTAHDEDEKGYEFHTVTFKDRVPKNFVASYSRTQFRMPLELAKSHLTKYRKLVKVED